MKKNRKYKRYNDIYVVGSNAAKIEKYYEIPERTEKEVRVKPRKNKKLKSKTVKANPVYTLVLVSVIMATLATCIILMKVQFAVTESSVTTRKLQNELNDLKNQNAQLEAVNKEAVDLKEIYKRATEELGMILPKKENIQYVDSKPVTYTKQFSDIPREEEGASVGNVLGIISKGW